MGLRMGAAVFSLVVLGVLAALVFSPTDGAAAASVCAPVTIGDFDLPGVTTTTSPDEPTTLPSISTTQPKAATSTAKVKKSTTKEATANKPVCSPFVYRMSYPLATQGSTISVLGDVREGGGRLHAGTDIASPTLTPVLAVRDGEIVSMHNTRGSADDCCWLTVEHDDGWSSLYIHLNNDTYATDDGFGLGVRADLAIGDRVVAGELIGWVGDSGNAENTTRPHLHFELHLPNGIPIDAAASISAARRSATPPPPAESGHPYDIAADYLASHGVAWACDSLRATRCPDLPVVTADLEKAVHLLLGIIVTGLEGTYGNDAIHGVDPGNFIQKKMLGCDDLRCEPNWVTRAELARLAAIAGRQTPATEGLFVNESNLVNLPDREAAVSFLRMTGGLGKCELPLDAETILRRDEAAYLLVTWAGLLPIDPCPEIDLPIR